MNDKLTLIRSYLFDLETVAAAGVSEISDATDYRTASHLTEPERLECAAYLAADLEQIAAAIRAILA